MISIDYNLVVPRSLQREIGYATLVRAYPAKCHIFVINDGTVILQGLSVRLALESYVGQEKPQLFGWSDTKVIKEIPPKGKALLEFTLLPIFPGLVSIALYVTDAPNSAIMAKRKTDTNYAKAPVRWWFHVIDNISLETLRSLKTLAAAGGKKTKK